MLASRFIGLVATSIIPMVTLASDHQAELLSTLNDQQSVAVTIYQNDLALVKDVRNINLNTGLNVLALRDVSTQIRPETALLRSINAPGSLTVVEQYFDHDLLSPNKILEQFVGKQVTIVKTNPATGAETTEKAIVLSANNGVVLKMGNRIETGIFGRIVYDNVPGNLRDRPTLITQLNNTSKQSQTIELSYLTGGLSWKADYVVQLNAKEDRVDLSGWVTLSNTSGASYHDAALQLVAGDVHQVQLIDRPMMKSMRGGLMMAETAAQMVEEDLLEYHLYRLDRPTTIVENQTKQVALLAANAIPARKSLLLRGADYYYSNQYSEIGSKLKVEVFVEFDNKEAAKLGMPLPQGIMRVYKKDSEGHAQFLGEDSINHTPNNETVRLLLGNAFDVTADKKQTDFQKVSDKEYQSAFEIKLKNAKKEAVSVLVQEPIGGDWRILSESAKHIKVNSRLAQWKIDVPAASEVTLTYRATVKY
jgi:hypothetical protein